MEYALSAKEFLYLCAAAGGRQIFGVEDVFDSVIPEEMSSELRKIHSDLENENYIESDFDGESSMNENLLKSIECCIASPIVVMVHSFKKSDVQKVSYYISEEKCVAAFKDNDTYLIKDYNRKNLESDIKSFLTLKSGCGFIDIQEASFLIRELEDLKKELQQGKTDRIKCFLKDKTSDTMADAIVCALSEAGDIYSIVLVDSRGPDVRIENVTAVDTDKGVLRFNPLVSGLENAVSIIACSQEDIRSSVIKLISSI